jgi:hypothetical protein
MRFAGFYSESFIMNGFTFSRVFTAEDRVTPVHSVLVVLIYFLAAIRS